MKSEQLLTQGKIFEDDILAGPECTNHPAEDVPEPYDHAQNLTGTLPIELAAKSLILRVCDVLMTHNDGGAEKVKPPSAHVRLLLQRRSIKPPATTVVLRKNLRQAEWSFAVVVGGVEMWKARSGFHISMPLLIVSYRWQGRHRCRRPSLPTTGSSFGRYMLIRVRRSSRVANS